MSAFSERLKHAMDERGVKSQWVAEKAGTSPANLSRYVNGQHDPAVLEIITRIATALNVSVDYLLGISDTMTLLPSAATRKETQDFVDKYAHLILDKDFLRYVAVYNALPTDRRKFLVASSESFAAAQGIRID